MEINKNHLLNALTLKERTALFPVDANQDKEIAASPVSHERLKKWKSQFPYNDAEKFKQKLAALGIDQSQFLLLLDDAGHRPESFPAWIERLSEIYKTFDFENSTYLSDGFKTQTPLAVFFDFVEPIISDGRRRLKEKMEKEISADTPFDMTHLEHLFTFNIGFTLFETLNRVMVLELNVSRLSGQLHGETSQARFDHFSASLRTSDKINALLEEYPVIFRDVMQFIDRWVENSFSLTRHLCSDWQELQEQFHVPDIAEVVKIQHSAGDRHNNGKTVSIIHFKSGKKIVYKPRSLATDIHFQALLNWFNQQAVAPPLKTLRIVNKEDYGWVEYINHVPCRDEEELTRYHQRIGALLCILYMLNATDFHFENIIAAGEDPVLIDLESLFHYLREFDSATSSADIFNHMERSVLKINLLPFRYSLGEKFKGMDLGGMSDIDGNLTPKPVAAWDADGTDEMKLTRVHLPMTGQKNLPKLGESNVTPDKYVQTIQESFKTCYLHIKENQQQLIAPDGLLDAFKNAPVRLLFRPTMVYAQLLETSTHPDYLRNQVDRDLWFERLHQAVGDRKITQAMIDAEQAAFNKTDVPIYVSTPGSRDLDTDLGLIKDYFSAPGLEEAKEKLRSFSREDCLMQCWYIRASVATAIGADTAGPLQFERLQEAPVPADRNSLLTAARSVAVRLKNLAVRKNNTANWIGMFLNKENFYEIKPLNIDLYSGLTGVVLFYGYWQAITQDDTYGVLLNESLKSLETYSDSMMKARIKNATGVFAGLGGVAYAYHHLGFLLDRKDLSAKAYEVLHYLEETFEPADNKNVDIISGSAGLILVIKNLLMQRSDSRLKAFAVKLGEHLLETAVPLSVGKGWQIVSKEPLAGFGHGTAGIAYALSQLYHITNDTRFQELCDDALAYERSLFMPEKGNWMDMRDLSVESGNQRLDKANMVAWCNGAVGIGLSRLGIMGTSPSMIDELKIAVNTTLTAGLGKNHSLCHGDLGNLDFLYKAALFLKDNSLQERVYRYVQAVTDNIRDQGFSCGVPLKVETPGLMTGISGIGYQLLRFAYPDRVPSVLLLEAPIA